MTALLDVRDVHKTYGDLPALRGVSLRAAPGAIVCLLGPSGCGKSTLLRLVAGLEEPDSGAILLDGESLAGVPTHRRGFGLMFQDYALFPHLDVAANVAFGLRMRREPAPAVRARVAELLDLVGLAGYERRRVYQLSGGERQRVALARTLAPRPRLLMLDEPLGALDRALRERLLDELAFILRRVGLTTLYVTHDQEEAFAIGDALVLMRAGRIEQAGPPQMVYRAPATPFAARFLGIPNLVPVTVREAAAGGEVMLDSAVGRLTAPHPPDPTILAAVATVAIRPEGAAPAGAGAAGAPNIIAGTIVERSFRGSRTRVTIRHESGQPLTFDLDAPDLPAIGEPIALQIRPDAISLLSAGARDAG